MKISWLSLATLISIIFTSASTWGQSTYSGEGSIPFIEPEFSAGRVVHNYAEHPKTGLRNGFAINMGQFSNNVDEHWAYYYNQPSTGISLSYGGVGNKEVFGNEISLIPYILLNTARKRKSLWYFKLGLGLSYFTKFYDPESNIQNEVIGSRFTYAFQIFLYKSIMRNDWIELKAGGGYHHSSNGHTQLPNFGMNSALLSISAQFFTRPIDLEQNAKNINFKADRTKHYFITTRFGYGWQEYGGPRGPIGGPKKGIHSFMIAGGIIFRQHIKVRTGFTYRLYDHYLDDINENTYLEYIDNPKWNASNIYFFVGTEFLIGHVGMDVEGGINLHKPFYEKFHEKFDGRDDYWFKNTFPARLGINYYLLNTNRKPAHNLFLGMHVNANGGQADFAELSVGYVYMIK